jgi:hypothetical protein
MKLSDHMKLKFATSCFGAAMVFAAPCFSQSKLLPETANPSIGYATVEKAFSALSGKTGVQISVQGGWTIASDKEAKTIWSFTPKDHPAHPSVVKRTIAERDGSIYVDMNILCEASKAACDQLVSEFNDLNDRAKQNMAKGSR